MSNKPASVETLVRSIRRQFCHKNDVPPNIAAISIGRQLAEMEDTEANWKALTLDGLTPAVIHSCLQAMARKPKNEMVIGEWLVVLDKTLETSYCLDGCIPAFSRATVLTGRNNGTVQAMWRKLSNRTQQNLIQSIVQLTFELKASWDDITATLTPLIYCVVLKSPALAHTVLQQVQNAVWRHPRPPDAMYTDWAQRILVLYSSMSYCETSIASDWCCHILDCLEGQLEESRNVFLQRTLPDLCYTRARALCHPRRRIVS